MVTKVMYHSRSPSIWPIMACMVITLSGCGCHSAWTATPDSNVLVSEAWTTDIERVAGFAEQASGHYCGGDIRIVSAPFYNPIVPGQLDMGITITPTTIWIAASRDGTTILQPLETATAWEVCNAETSRFDVNAPRISDGDFASTPACNLKASQLASDAGIQ